MRINLADFIDKLVKKKVSILGVYVLQHGEPMGSFYWNDCFERPHNINSCSKSVTSLAVGIAVGEGLLGLDEKIVDCFADRMPEKIQQFWPELKIRDLLKMATGHDYNVLPRIGRDAFEHDWLSYIFNSTLAYKPGTHFFYNNSSPYLISRLIEQRSKKTLRNWLIPRLFDPLDIKNPQWFTCPQEHTLGLGGLFLTVQDLAKVGQLCLNEGEWNGKRLVPAEYIREATAKHIDSDFADSPTIDFQSGYGYYFWRNSRSDSYRGYGSGGQFMIVLPHQDAVVSIISSEVEGDLQRVIDAVWEGIVPQL